jgi:hypothetical protein
MVRALAPATVKSEPKFQEKEAQGLKPNSFLRLYGTTFSRALIQSKKLVTEPDLEVAQDCRPIGATPSDVSRIALLADRVFSCPATILHGCVTLPFVIPSAAEGSAVQRNRPGNVFG